MFLTIQNFICYPAQWSVFMIRTENIKKSFDKIEAVNDVTLHIAEKEIFGLVGPDGAGKTTLMRILCGLITPDYGQVFIMGHDPDDKSQLESCFGYMPQHFSLYGDLSVIENIILFGRLFGLDPKIIYKRANEILKITDLFSYKARFADHLSGGMKQKLSLTCALVTRPKILILDEPTFGVDPESRKDIWKILYELNQSGMTILISTPYMDEAELCTKIAFMNTGKIMIEDTPSSLKSNYNCTVYELFSNVKDITYLKKYLKENIIDIYQYGDRYHVVIPNTLLKQAEKRFVELENDSIIHSSHIITSPSMEDIFVFYSNKEVVQ